ncbi:MAG: RNA polymerase sigma factor [bacterium]
MELAKQGDNKALEELCKEVEEVIKGFFSSRYSDSELIKDLVQETYLRLLKSLAHLKNPFRFSSFVIKIAQHVHQEYLLTKCKSKEITQENMAATSINHISDNFIEKHPYLKIEDKIDLEWAFKRLPPKTQKILKMKMEGFKYQEIANFLDLSIAAVKMDVKRGIKKLKYL